MPCYRPLTAWRTPPDAGNRRGVTFAVSKADTQVPINLPCGRCIGCRLERSRQWAIRCTHEASVHDHNQFVTLTYDDENIPDNHSLRPEDTKKFCRRLQDDQPGARYFLVGEYGDNTQRPHYHAILFNTELDREPLQRTKSGSLIYTSERLKEYWPHGHANTAEATFKSAAYCARYAMKKITGDQASDHYGLRHPEFQRTSRNPAIGLNWLKKHSKEMRRGFIWINGVKSAPPQYYLDKLEEIDPETAAIYETQTHQLDAKKLLVKQLERIDVRETCKKRQIQRLHDERTVRATRQTKRVLPRGPLS